MKRAVVVVGLVMLAVLAGWSRDVSAFEISEQTNSNYQAYLKQIGSTKRGAFAVSDDGIYSYYIYCIEISCQTGLADEARQECEILSGGKDCIVMAVGRDLKVEITVSPSRTKLSPEDEISAFILDAERLQALTVGNTLRGEYPNGKGWVEFYDPSGEIRGRDDGQGTYTAKYRFDGDKMCFDYAGENDDWCGQISTQGNRIDFVESGDLVSFIRNTIMQPGNPEGL